MMLQHEFDQEHDVMLKREQDKMNGGSKGGYYLYLLCLLVNGD